MAHMEIPRSMLLQILACARLGIGMRGECGERGATRNARIFPGDSGESGIRASSIFPDVWFPESVHRGERRGRVRPEMSRGS